MSQRLKTPQRIRQNSFHIAITFTRRDETDFAKWTKHHGRND